MDRWGVPDVESLGLLGHQGGLTKNGTRPRFKLVRDEVEMMQSLQEIDAALVPLQLDPRRWLNQPIKAPPFSGATPIAHLRQSRATGVREILRFVLQQGLRLSMSAQT